MIRPSRSSSSGCHRRRIRICLTLALIAAAVALVRGAAVVDTSYNQGIGVKRAHGMVQHGGGEAEEMQGVRVAAYHDGGEALVAARLRSHLFVRRGISAAGSSYTHQHPPPRAFSLTEKKIQRRRGNVDTA